MHKLILIWLTLCFSAVWNVADAQSKQDEASIKNVINLFMQSIVQKDSATFYSLFHTDGLTWIGVMKDKSQQEDLRVDSTSKNNYFSSSYQNFFRSIKNKGIDEEKFYNVQIVQDGSIATVIFDYSFRHNKVKLNWGKEAWGLIKANGVWKIVSVIFSLEYERVLREPLHQ